MSKKEKIFYVSNKQLYEDYISWYEDLKTNPNKEPPKYIIESMMKMCQKLALRPNFYNYSYKDEMISSAQFACFSALKKFNIEKSDNPFSYFTTVAYNAFVHVINKEKHQTNIKSKIISEIPPEDLFELENCLGDEYENTMRTNIMEMIRENNQ